LGVKPNASPTKINPGITVPGIAVAVLSPKLTPSDCSGAWPLPAFGSAEKIKLQTTSLVNAAPVGEYASSRYLPGSINAPSTTAPAGPDTKTAAFVQTRREASKRTSHCKAGTTFNFVITSPKPFTTPNLTAKVSCLRLLLKGGKLADVQTDVQIH
jgi:hypothetical protein